MIEEIGQLWILLDEFDDLGDLLDIGEHLATSIRLMGCSPELSFIYTIAESVHGRVEHLLHPVIRTDSA